MDSTICRQTISKPLPDYYQTITKSLQTVSDYTVVVFPENRARWILPSAFVRGVRARDGGYDINALPPADYLAIAVEALPPSARTDGGPPLPLDAELLERLWSQATPFRLDEGEQQVLNLCLARTPPDWR